MTAPFRKPLPNGRSSGIRYGREGKFRAPPKGSPWCWLTTELLASEAWRALSVNGRRFIDFLMIEHTSHAATENGNLGVTYDQLVEFGLTRRLIKESIRETVFLGLVRVMQKGGLSFGDVKRLTRYRLTFYADRDGNHATNEWKGVGQDKVDEWRRGRRLMRKTGVGVGMAIVGAAPLRENIEGSSR